MDRDSLPRWAWLLGSLLSASLVATLVNQFALFPLGLPEAYGPVTVTAAMSPVLIYVGIWLEPERRDYWQRSRAAMAGDVGFVVTGAVLGTAIVLVALVDAGVGQLLREIPALLAGFLLAYGLFWMRNPDYVGTVAE